MSEPNHTDSDINWPGVAIFVVLIGIVIIAAQAIPALGQSLKDILSR